MTQYPAASGIAQGCSEDIVSIQAGYTWMRRANLTGAVRPSLEPVGAVQAEVLATAGGF